jgi:Thymidylate synthase complementing protein
VTEVFLPEEGNGLIYAKVIADSISPLGFRLTTFEACFNRFVLAEVNTYRMFSRSSASSRAIPLHKQLAKVRERPAEPVVWPAEQKGMQGGAEVADPDTARFIWGEAAKEAADRAEGLGNYNVHKSVANRLLEPFLMHTAVITATETPLEHFFSERCHPDAQPEFRVAAEAMRAAYQASTPDDLGEGQWHLPYIDAEDIRAAEEYLLNRTVTGLVSKERVTKVLVAMSSARCARVSYETQAGKRDIDGEGGDLDLYSRLVENDPTHFSPLEHPCTPWDSNVQKVEMEFRNLDGRWVTRTVTRPKVGNFIGWRQHRFEVETIKSRRF